MNEAKICPLMSRMVPASGGLAGGMTLQLAGVPCAGESCGWWSIYATDVHFGQNGKNPEKVTSGACSLVVIAGIEPEI